MSRMLSHCSVQCFCNLSVMFAFLDRGGLRSITLSRQCRKDAESLHLHSRSPGKKRPLRRRPPSDDEAQGEVSCQGFHPCDLGGFKPGMYSSSSGKKRFLRRRPPSDHEADGEV